MGRLKVCSRVIFPQRTVTCHVKHGRSLGILWLLPFTSVGVRKKRTLRHTPKDLMLIFVLARLMIFFCLSRLQVAWLEANVYKREGQLRKVLTQHPQASVEVTLEEG